MGWLSVFTLSLVGLDLNSRHAGQMTRLNGGIVADLVGQAQVDMIKEPLAKSLLSKVELIDVKVSTDISPQASVSTTFAKFTKALTKSSPPIVMLHGFDSSCLEFRRIAPLLSEKGFDVYVPDILGWGFNPPSQSIRNYTPKAKVEHLISFVKHINGGKPVVVAGASLGGALACILAAEYSELISKVVLIDAQGFIDGDGPSSLPDPLARFGVNVLKSQPLRMFANFIAYKDKKFATFDAMRVGRLHCYLPTWEDASVSFLLSGGFSPSEKVRNVKQDTLVLWGDSDQILDPSTAAKFEETLPGSCTIKWCKSGHVPHLEQPEGAADAIASFLSTM